MDKNIWTFVFFYGNVILLIIIFLIVLDKSRLKELLPVGLLIGLENYTAEIIGTHYGFWKYPLDNPGYPEVTIISSLIYFPIIAMIFAQYLSKSFKRNIKLTALFLTMNIIIEIVVLKTTDLFKYGRGLNLFIAFLMYLMAYVLIISFKYVYDRLD